MASPLQGQQSTGCRKTCGKGAKRTQILAMGCSTPGLALGQGSPGCRFNGGILLANLLQSSRSTFSRGSFLSFFAFKEGMLGTPISVLGGWPTVSACLSERGRVRCWQEENGKPPAGQKPPETEESIIATIR